ncbi:MAG: hypothetical protein WC515_06250 [Candidatus Omnitrophota bacterium]
MTNKPIKKETDVEITYGIKILDSPTPKANSKDIRSAVTKEKTVEKFRSIAQNYVTVLDVLWQYTQEIGLVANNTSLLNFTKLPTILDELRARNKKASSTEKPVANFTLSIKKKNLKKKEAIIPIFEISHLKKLSDYFRHNDKALHLLHETVLQQMVNAWEKVLASLLEWKFKSSPDIIPKERTITYSDILSFNDFDDVQKHLIENEIDEFLKRNTTSDQIKYFKENLNVDLRSNFSFVDDLCEVVLRRHAIVHAGGIASGEYLNRVKKLRNLTFKVPAEGNDLSKSDSYVIRAWCILYAAGVILLHLLAVDHARGKKSKEDEEYADEFLNNAAYNNIKNKQYFSAELILEYANNRHLASSISALMGLINLAQTYKWQGNVEKCKALLNGHNWQSCSADFKTCVAALNEDYEAFCKNLKIAVQEKTVTLESLYEWPVFQSMRNVKTFKQDVKDITGLEFNESDIQNTPTLLDFDSKEKLDDFFKKLSKDDTLPLSNIQSE